MDLWKYFDIIHCHHLLCNPMSIAKLDELFRLMNLKPGDQVLDIASGKGEVLVRLAETYRIQGVGVDLSPFMAKDAENKRDERIPGTNVNFLLMNGADYQPEEPQAFEVAMCLGASWIWGGHRGTLQALKAFIRPGGLIVTGEPYWLTKPSREYLDVSGFEADAFSTHYGNVKIGEEEGLTFLYSVVSSQDDWDRYEGLQWYAIAEHARSHPHDPDLPELWERLNQSRDMYLKWGRDTLSWAVYLFRKAV
jgi:SAM-dependent methyltransferase